MRLDPFRPENPYTPRANALVRWVQECRLGYTQEHAKASPNFALIKDKHAREHDLLELAAKVEAEELARPVETETRFSPELMVEWLGQHPYCKPAEYAEATGWSESWLRSPKGRAMLQGVRKIQDPLRLLPSSGHSPRQAESIPHRD